MNLEPTTVTRMAATLPNLVGIKDSSGKLQQTIEYIRQCPPTFRVFQGRDELLHESFKQGAIGGVAATGNVALELVMEVYRAHEAAMPRAARRRKRSSPCCAMLLRSAHSRRCSRPPWR